MPSSAAGLLSCDHVDSATFAVKHHVAVYQCVQGVVVALTNACAWVEFVTYLADQNIASTHHFAAKFLDASSLCVGVATVAAGPLSFLMCHQN